MAALQALRNRQLKRLHGPSVPTAHSLSLRNTTCTDGSHPIYVYIYIYRERERDRERYAYTYTYTCICLLYIYQIIIRIRCQVWFLARKWKITKKNKTSATALHTSSSWPLGRRQYKIIRDWGRPPRNETRTSRMPTMQVGLSFSSVEKGMKLPVCCTQV